MCFKRSVAFVEQLLKRVRRGLSESWIVGAGELLPDEFSFCVVIEEKENASFVIEDPWGVETSLKSGIKNEERELE